MSRISNSVAGMSSNRGQLWEFAATCRRLFMTFRYHFVVSLRRNLTDDEHEFVRNEVAAGEWQVINTPRLSVHPSLIVLYQGTVPGFLWSCVISSVWCCAFRCSPRLRGAISKLLGFASVGLRLNGPETWEMRNDRCHILELISDISGIWYRMDTLHLDNMTDIDFITYMQIHTVYIYIYLNYLNIPYLSLSYIFILHLPRSFHESFAEILMCSKQFQTSMPALQTTSPAAISTRNAPSPRSVTADLHHIQ